MSLSRTLGSLRFGNGLLIICCILYLAWWAIAFHPEKSFPAAPKYVLFCLTLLAGVGGIVFLARSMSALPVAQGKISDAFILLGGVLFYGIMLLLSDRLLHRQVTTELLLITLWMALECCVVNSLYRAASMTASAAIVCAAVIILAAVLCMVCYLLYYRLEQKAAYFDGMIPLVLAALVMLAGMRVI